MKRDHEPVRRPWFLAFIGFSALVFVWGVLAGNGRLIGAAAFLLAVCALHATVLGHDDPDNYEEEDP